MINMKEAILRLKNLGNNRYRESDVPAAINQLNVVVKDVAVITDGIVNATVRDNILFGKDYDKTLFLTLRQ